MKALRNFIDKIKPSFSKGGKYHFLHSTFDAFETFLFVPKRVTTSGTHIKDAIDSKRTMVIVVLAALPALLFGMYNAGLQYFMSINQEATFWEMFAEGAWQVLPIIIVCYVVGLGIEFASAQIRGHEVNEGFLVSGFLIPLILPANIPLWTVALATAFAVIIGKEIFGGTGMNIFNPALLARAFLFFAYPSQMSGDKVWIKSLYESNPFADATTGATPLAQLTTGNITQLPNTSDMFFGFIPGSIGETSTFCILLGAVLLIYTGVASWKIMLSVFAGAYLTGLLFNGLATLEYFQDDAHRILHDYLAIAPEIHLMIGGLAFGAVFMATDPVTAAQTERGKWIYGFLIGIMVVVIRVFNPAYPEGMMLAILLMNAFAPLIDHYVVQGNINKRLKRAIQHTKN